MFVCSSSSTRTQAVGGGGEGDNDAPRDQVLSDILDEVIENMPDADRPAPDVSVLDVETNRPRPDFAVSYFMDSFYSVFNLHLSLHFWLSNIIAFYRELKMKTP